MEKEMDSYTFSSDSTSSFFVKETTDDNNVVDGSDLTGSILELNNENQLNQVRNEIVINSDDVPISDNMIKIENFETDMSANLDSNGIFVITVDDADTHTVNPAVDSKLNKKNDTNGVALNTAEEGDNAENFTPTGDSLERSDFENKFYLNPCDLEVTSGAITENVEFNTGTSVQENEESNLLDDKNSDKFDMEHFLSFKGEKNKNKESADTKRSYESNTVLQKYFTEYDSNSVKCNLCSDVLIYQGDVSNLMLHMRLIHNKNKKQSIARKTANVWKYFTKLETNKVKCNLCSSCVIYKQKVSNLIKHLRITHADVKFLKSSVSRSASNVANDKTESIGEVPSSDVIVIQNSQGKLLNQIKINKSWKCFTKLPNSDKMICNICKRIFAQNKTHELLQHLHVEHKSLLSTKNQVIQQSINDMKILSNSETNSLGDSTSNLSNNVLTNETRNKSSIKSKIWKYFTNDGEIRCNACDEIFVNDNISDLLQHLDSKHSDIYKEFSVYGTQDEIEKILNDDSDVKSLLDGENELNMITAYKQLPSSRNKPVSDTWNHFTKLNDVSKVRCNYCNNMLKYTAGISSNLTRHLRLKHKEVFNNKTNGSPSCDKKELSISEDIESFPSGGTQETFDSIEPENSDSFINESNNTGDLEGISLRLDENTSLKEASHKQRKTKAKFKNSESEFSNAKRKSTIWNYFVKLSSGKYVRCSLCSEKMLFNSSSTNRLLRHLTTNHDIHLLIEPRRNKASAYKHSSIISNSKSKAEKYIPSKNKPSLNDDSNSDSSTGSLSNDGTVFKAKSEAIVIGRTWKNFTKLDRDKARCNICNKTFTYKLGQTSNLIKHLQVQHKRNDDKEKNKQSKEVNSEDNTSSNTLENGTKSNQVYNKNQIIAKYFSKLEDSRVMCNLCEFPNIYSYSKNSRGNLIRHLNVKHKYILDLELNENNGNVAECNVPQPEQADDPSDFKTIEDSSNNNEGSNNNSSTSDYETKDVLGDNDENAPEINMRSLYEYLTSDDKLKKCIKYEEDEIKCKICSGSFPCDDLINYEYTIRYHVQIFHAEWTVLCSNETVVKRECVSPEVDNSEDVGSTDLHEPVGIYGSNYNELEAIANEVNSFMGASQETSDPGSVIKSDPQPDRAAKKNDSDDEIWKYFTKLTSQNVRCNYCSTLLSYRRNKKWNLYRHLKNSHGKFKNKKGKEKKKKLKHSKKATSLLGRPAKLSKRDLKYNYNSDIESEKPAVKKGRFESDIKESENTDIDKSTDSGKGNINSLSKKLSPVKPAEDVSEGKSAPFSSNNTPVNRKIGRTWSHFTKVDLGRANCNICNEVLKYRGSGIDVLNNHLSTKHSDNFGGETTSKEQQNFKQRVVNKRRISPFEERNAVDKENGIFDESPACSDKEDSIRGDEPHKKRGDKVWQYFTRLGDDYGQCHLCLSEVLYRSTTSLLHHLERVHSVLSLSSIKEKEPISKQEREKSKLLAAVDLTPAKSQNKNRVCFIRFSNSLVRCKFCSRIILHKSGNMHKLMSHLLFKHRNEMKQYKSLKNVAFVDNGDEITLTPSIEKRKLSLTPNLEPFLQKVKVDKRKRFRSSSWLYFTKLNEHYAECNICNNKFSYKGGSIYNLTRHLFIKHDIKLIKRFDTRSNKTARKSSNNPVLSKPLTPRKKRETLLFYKKVNRDLVRCKLCLKLVMYNGINISNLMNHLWSSHLTKLIGFDDSAVSTFDDDDEQDEENDDGRTDVKGLDGSALPEEEPNEKDENAEVITDEITSNGKQGCSTWNYFKYLDGKKKYMQCNICKKKLLFKAANLSNLSRHLKKSHNIKKIFTSTAPVDNNVNPEDKDENSVNEEKLWPNDISDDQFKFPFTDMYNKEKDKLGKDKNQCILNYFIKENEDKELRCNICNDVFDSNTNKVMDLKAHLTLKHNIAEFSSLTENSEDTPMSDFVESSKSTNVETVSGSSDEVIQNVKMSKMKCKLCYKEFICRPNKINNRLLEHLKNVHLNDLQDSEGRALISPEPCSAKKNIESQIEGDLKKESNKTDDNLVSTDGASVSTSEMNNGLNNLKIKQILVRYFKNLNSFKNKCKICYKYISNRMPCNHRITNDLLIKYGIKRVKVSSSKESDNRNEEKKIKTDEGNVDVKESIDDADSQSKQSNEKPLAQNSKLRNFMDVNLYENKCYECNFTLHYSNCCIHQLNLWLVNESKKTKHLNNIISTDCNNQFSINNEVQLVDTLQKNQNNLIIITGNEDSPILNYDITNRNENISQEISYHIMNSINDIDDENIKVIIYNYNSENTENEKNCDNVKISEVTDENSHAEEIKPPKDANGLEEHINHIVNELNNSRQLIYNEGNMLSEEHTDVTSTVIRQEIVESTSADVAINEDNNCLTMNNEEAVINLPESRKLFDIEKLTKLAEVSCNEQFYKQSSLARFTEQPVITESAVPDTEVVIQSAATGESSADRSDRCIVETIYPPDKIEGYSNNISLDETRVRESVVEQADYNYGDEITSFDTKENLESDNINCVIGNAISNDESQLVDNTVQTYVKEDESNKPNVVLNEDVINAIFNNVIVNFQECAANEAVVEQIKFNDDNIIIPTGVCLQKLNSLYKVSKNILHFANINYEYKTAKCNLCDIYFEFNEPIIYNLLMHLFTNHKDKILVEESINKKVTKDNKDCNVEEKNRRKSPVWKYFVNDKNFRANCKICNFSFSYKGGAINNLSRHLRLRHGIIVTAKNLEDNCKTVDFMVNYPKRRSAVKLRSRTWNYFSKEPNDWAKCRICKKYLSYRSSTINNLTRHMRTIHSKIFNSLYSSKEPFFIKNEDGTILDSLNFDIKNDEGESIFLESENSKTREQILQQCSAMEQSNTKRKSIVWNYFTETSQNCGKCNFCTKVISCKGGGTSNLSRHLRSKHGIWIVLTSNLSQTFSESMNSTELRQSLGDVIISQNAEGNDTIITQEQLQILKSKKLIHKKSKTWEYFTKESNERVRCNLCSKPLSYKCKAVHNLRRHLAKKHPSYVVKQEPIRLKLQVNAENDVLHNSNFVESSEINNSNKKFIDITDASVVILDEENQPPPHRPDRNTRPKKSVVWNYFEELEYGIAKCLMCFKILSFRGGGTNNLMRHLRCRHSIIIVNNGNNADPAYEPVDSESLKESSVTNEDVDKDITDGSKEVAIAGHVLTEVFDQPATDENNDTEIVNVGKLVES